MISSLNPLSTAKRFVQGPLNLAVPDSRRHQNRQFAQSRLQTGAVPDELAQTLGSVGHLGAVQPDPEWPHDAAPGFEDGVVDTRLRLVQFRALQLAWSVHNCRLQQRLYSVEWADRDGQTSAGSRDLNPGDSASRIPGYVM